MQKKFISNLTFLLLLNVMVKPFWILGIDRTVQNIVGFETYGLYFSLFNFSYLFHIVLDLGINNYNNKTLAQNNQLLKIHFSNILALKLLLTVGYIMVTFIIAYFLKFNIYQFKLLSLLALNQIMASLVLYFRSNLAGLHLFKTDAVLSVLDKLLMIIICSLLIWGNIFDHSLSIEWFIYAQTFSYILTVLAGFYLVAKRTGLNIIKPKISLIGNIIKRSYPYGLLMLMMAIYYKVDAVMIERMLPDDGALEAGYYAASFRLLDATNMLGFLFAGLLLPIFSKMLKQKQPIDALLILSFRSLIIIAVTVSISSFIFRQEIMDLLYIHSNTYSANLFGLLIFAFIPVSTVYIFGSLLTANGNLLQLNILAFCGIIVNIILNYFLIQESKAYGATQATLITQILIAAVHILIVKTIFNMKVNMKLIIQILGFTLALLSIIKIVTFFINNWIINIIVITISSILIAFALKFIELKKMILLFKENKE